MNNMIKAFLEGKVTPKCFVEIMDDKQFREEVDNFFPKELASDPDAPFWEDKSYLFYKRHQFRLSRVLDACYAWNCIGTAYSAYEELKSIAQWRGLDLQYSSKYTDMEHLYLDVAAEHFEGIAVADVLDEIIESALQEKTKKAAKEEAKKKLKDRFHVQGKKMPHWIQGAEWPMGEKSPMQFVESKRIVDGKKFIFRDVDTGQILEILQHY